MWSDNETGVDLLRYAYLTSGVGRIVRSKHLLPTTVGIFGDWGSGKSSLLKMIQEDLEQDPNVMCLTFDGWLFEGYEDAKTALMGTILDAIHDRVKEDATLWEKVGERLKGLRQRVNWLRLAAMTGRVAIPALTGLPDPTGGVDPSGLAADVASGLRLSPRRMRRVCSTRSPGERRTCAAIFGTSAGISDYSCRKRR